jgi:hypothetical protein
MMSHTMARRTAADRPRVMGGKAGTMRRAQHGPEAWPPTRQSAFGHHLEPLSLIEPHMARDARFQIAGERLGIGACQERLEEGAADPMPLPGGGDAQRVYILVGHRSVAVMPHRRQRQKRHGTSEHSPAALQGGCQGTGRGTRTKSG